MTSFLYPMSTTHEYNTVVICMQLVLNLKGSGTIRRYGLDVDVVEEAAFEG